MCPCPWCWCRNVLFLRCFHMQMWRWIRDPSCRHWWCHHLFRQNECVTDSHGCKAQILNYHINASATANGDITQRPAECINTIGSFVYGCVDTGFTTDVNDEKNCFVIGDCLLAPCGINVHCKDLDYIAAAGSNRGYVNLENTFECGCKTGWEPTNCAFAESDDSMACSAEILAKGCKNVDECVVGLVDGKLIAVKRFNWRKSRRCS